MVSVGSGIDGIGGGWEKRQGEGQRVWVCDLGCSAALCVMGRDEGVGARGGLRD